jgi:hypothetical protein
VGEELQEKQHNEQASGGTHLNPLLWVKEKSGSREPTNQ